NQWDELCAVAGFAGWPPTQNCATFETKCSHSMDQIGSILGTPAGATGSYKSCDPTGTPYLVKATCVDTVCKLMPQCCCGYWSAACVGQYTALKLGADPNCK
ncbi:MAG TPA: hypothetical protein PKA88_22250, partial [Polyangiaceae bacterium]|nr:hypothetical protein [Polyangiaceae bacterium]